jgi:hypothetical protein
MDSLANFRERFEALEQQTEQLKHETQALERFPSSCMASTSTSLGGRAFRLQMRHTSE